MNGETGEWKVPGKPEAAELPQMSGLLSFPVGESFLVGCQRPAPEPTYEFCTQPSLPTNLEPPETE